MPGRGRRVRPQASIPLIVTSVILVSKLLMETRGSLVDVINAPVLSLIPLFIAHLLMRTLGGTRRISLNELPPT